MQLHASYTLGCEAETLRFFMYLVPICSESLWTGNGTSGAKKACQHPNFFHVVSFGHYPICTDY